jgi:hypothetical protein
MNTPDQYQPPEFQPFRHPEVGTVIAILTSPEHFENEDRKKFVQYFVDFLTTEQSSDNCDYYDHKEACENALKYFLSYCIQDNFPALPIHERNKLLIKVVVDIIDIFYEIQTSYQEEHVYSAEVKFKLENLFVDATNDYLAKFRDHTLSEEEFPFDAHNGDQTTGLKYSSAGYHHARISAIGLFEIMYHPESVL